MWIVILTIICLLILFFAWAICASAGMADQKMDELLNRKHLSTEPNFPEYLPDPRTESDLYEKVICPNCHHENFIVKGSCSFCEICHQKIGSCDE